MEDTVEDVRKISQWTRGNYHGGRTENTMVDARKIPWWRYGKYHSGGMQDAVQNIMVDFWMISSWAFRRHHGGLQANTQMGHYEILSHGIMVSSSDTQKRLFWYGLRYPSGEIYPKIY